MFYNVCCAFNVIKVMAAIKCEPCLFPIGSRKSLILSQVIYINGSKEQFKCPTGRIFSLHLNLNLNRNLNS